MREGWYNDDYLILFEEAELAAASDRYQISQLSGYQIVGFRSWDDLIVRDAAGHTYSIPTVGTDLLHLEPFVPANGEAVLKSDDRFTGKIKWYIKPILFGGSPRLGENVTWVSHEEHAPLVKWWNDQYHQLKARKSNPIN
jgi:hypothetical protein